MDQPRATSPRVAIVTGASQGIGAGVVAAFRAAGYAVVGTARAMPASDDPGLLTVSGDIADAETAQTVIELTLEHFGRIDTLVNDAGVFIGKPFIDYSPDDYAAMVAVNLTGFFHHHSARHSTDGRPGAAATSSMSPPASSTTPGAPIPPLWHR